MKHRISARTMMIGALGLIVTLGSGCTQAATAKEKAVLSEKEHMTIISLVEDDETYEMKEVDDPFYTQADVDGALEVTEGEPYTLSMDADDSFKILKFHTDKEEIKSAGVDDVYYYVHMTVNHSEIPVAAFYLDHDYDDTMQWMTSDGEETRSFGVACYPKKYETLYFLIHNITGAKQEIEVSVEFDDMSWLKDPEFGYIEEPESRTDILANLDNGNDEEDTVTIYDPMLFQRSVLTAEEGKAYNGILLNYNLYQDVIYRFKPEANGWYVMTFSGTADDEALNFTYRESGKGYINMPKSTDDEKSYAFTQYMEAGKNYDFYIGTLDDMKMSINFMITKTDN